MHNQKQAIRKPKDTYQYVHWLLGKTMDAPEVAKIQSMGLPYDIVTIEDRNTLGFKHKDAIDGDVIYSVEEIMAMNFQHIKKISETDAGSPVKDCVITVCHSRLLFLLLPLSLSPSLP